MSRAPTHLHALPGSQSVRLFLDQTSRCLVLAITLICPTVHAADRAGDQGRHGKTRMKEMEGGKYSGKKDVSPCRILLFQAYLLPPAITKTAQKPPNDRFYAGWVGCTRVPPSQRRRRIIEKHRCVFDLEPISHHRRCQMHSASRNGRNSKKVAKIKRSLFVTLRDTTFRLQRGFFLRSTWRCCWLFWSFSAESRDGLPAVLHGGGGWRGCRPGEKMVVLRSLVVEYVRVDRDQVGPQ